jgi:rhomboid family protein
MFPVGDDQVRGGPPPVVTVGLIALNLLAWGVVPREYSLVRDLPPTIPVPFWSTLLTSMFLHGGWMHLGGNMLYLWIFGDNLEKVMGAVRFAIFYLVCGLAASFAHIVFGPGSNIPAVGASGAISGVLGGYLVLFPRNRVRVLTRGGIAHVPALVVLGLWIVIQLISGIGSMAQTSETAGVAYMAHIGGFVAGLVLVKLMASARRPALA